MRRFSFGLLAAYAIVGAFTVVESRLRQGAEARTLEAGVADQGTTRLIGVGFATALVGTPLLLLSGRGRIAIPGVAGPALMIAGLGLRVWSARVLGRFYTRTLRVSGDQTVVSEGPYRLIRHPGYLGALVMWFGFGLAAANWLVTAGVMGIMAFAYSKRIRSEEAMLEASLGKPYRDYARTTWRLIPGVY